MICQISKISSLPLCPPIVYSLFPRNDPRSVSRISLFQSLLSDRAKLSESVVPLSAIYFSRRKPAVRACWLRVNQVSHRFGLNKLSRGKWGNRESRCINTWESNTENNRAMTLAWKINWIHLGRNLSLSLFFDEWKTNERGGEEREFMREFLKKIREEEWIFKIRREKERERGIFGQKIVLEESSLSLSLSFDKWNEREEEYTRVGREF